MRRNGGTVKHLLQATCTMTNRRCCASSITRFFFAFRQEPIALCRTVGLRTSENQKNEASICSESQSIFHHSVHKWLTRDLCVDLLGRAHQDLPCTSYSRKHVLLSLFKGCFGPMSENVAKYQGKCENNASGENDFFGRFLVHPTFSVFSNATYTMFLACFCLYRCSVFSIFLPSPLLSSPLLSSLLPCPALPCPAGHMRREESSNT